MKKEELVILLVSSLLIIPVTYGLISPALSYCADQNYTWEEGYCIFDDGERCVDWEFFRGECGSEYVREIPCKNYGECVTSVGCCEGLKELEAMNIYPSTGECTIYFGQCDGGGICSDCGNGLCEEFENECNCPGDCGGEVDCYSESFMPVNPGVECCPEQYHLSAKEEGIVGSAVCTAKCGNGICNSELESNYNCPQDCQSETDEFIHDGAQDSTDSDAISDIENEMIEEPNFWEKFLSWLKSLFGI